MKRNRTLRVVLMFIFLFSVFLMGPAAPAQAARGITLSPTEGTIGTRVTVTGVEFNRSIADDDRYAAIFFSSQEATTLDDIDSDVFIYELVKEGVWLDYNGNFETSFNIPSRLTSGKIEQDVSGGTYYVYVCHYITPMTIQTRIRAVAAFTVTMGRISLSPLRGTVETLLEVSGTDFSANRDIEITYDDSAVSIDSGSRQTSSTGRFTSIVRVPESTAGFHTVSAIVHGDEAVATFTVDPEILVSPPSGETATAAIISGTGFGRLKTVTIWFHNTVVAAETTSILGSFYADFTVPELQPGLYYIDAEEGSNLAKAKFSIVGPVPPAPPPPPEPSPVTSISDTTGDIGQGLVMGGSGFKANATVTIKYDEDLLTAVTTDDNGVFAAAFSVPVSQHGNHIITASDGENVSEIEFAVESVPPQVPMLLSPQAATKVSSPISFIWQAVTDSSVPVTYTLQIATSSDFSATSIVLEKEALTRPEYILTETERLRLGVDDAPYYWRVRAIDSALNEGSWSNPWTFYVVSGGLPSWAIIAIAVLAGILLLALGYFIRMKSSKM